MAGSGTERLPALRYGEAAPASRAALAGGIAHLRLRYKRPGETASRLIETPVLRSALRTQPSESLRFASTVAAYADALRSGTHLEDWDWAAIARSAHAVRGGDRWRLRAEFLELVATAGSLSSGDDTHIGMIVD